MKWSLLLLFCTGSVNAQLLETPDPRWTSERWDAQWIAPAGEGTHFGVYHFRKKFNLENPSQRFVIHISADNRYRLFVNGEYVTEGPQLSDLRHWRFESLNIAPYLKAGENVLAIQVTFYGDAGPVYMMGRRAALLIQGDGKSESVVNTDVSWKHMRDESITPLVFKPGQPDVSGQYYAAGPMDRVEGGKYPWGWENPGFNDGDWKTSMRIQEGAPLEVRGYGDEQWELVPRNLPLMERTYEELNSLRRVDELEIHGGIPFNKKVPYTIPANRKVKLLFDQTRLTTAFPELITSKGKDRDRKSVV